MAKVTICALLYGDHLALARQCLESIGRFCPRNDYQLIVGSNAISETTRRFVQELQDIRAIDVWIDSPVNLNKCPMMRRMIEKADTEYLWWFDDDSFVTGPEAMKNWLGKAESSSQDVAMWGQLAMCESVDAFAPDIKDAVAFVRSASWYRGLPPPSWRPGGKGEFNFKGRGIGNGEWLFMVGGCWLIRTAVLRDLDWPDQRIVKMGDDVFLGEALRQHGWKLMNIGSPDVVLNSKPRRGDPGMQGVTASPATDPNS